MLDRHDDTVGGGGGGTQAGRLLRREGVERMVAAYLEGVGHAVEESAARLAHAHLSGFAVLRVREAPELA